MSLFNDVQEEPEEILAFRSNFDGLIIDMAQFQIILYPILLITLFLCAMHSSYSAILDQFCSQYKVLETATIDFAVNNV